MLRVLMVGLGNRGRSHAPAHHHAGPWIVGLVIRPAVNFPET